MHQLLSLSQVGSVFIPYMEHPVVILVNVSYLPTFHTLTLADVQEHQGLTYVVLHSTRSSSQMRQA